MRRIALSLKLVIFLVLVSSYAIGADPAIDDWGSPPGSPPPYQTNDIYVDNDGDGVVDEPGEPSKGIKNRLHVVVRNLGTAAAEDVTVWIGYAPYGMGYPHTHFKEIATVSGVSLAASGSSGDEQNIDREWDLSDLTEDNGGLWPYPVDQFDHFCVRVVLTYASDTDGTNNDAQNNFSNVELALGESKSFAFMAVNPGDEKADASLIFSEISKEWKIKVDGVKNPDRFVLKAKEQKLLKLIVMPVAGEDLQVRKQPVDVSLKLNGEIVGGLSFVVTVKQDGSPGLETSGGTMSAYLIGTYDLRDANTILQIVNPTADHLLVLVVFFDDNEKRLREVKNELTPNDMVEIDVRKAEPGAKLGVVKIVSFDPRTKKPKAGLVGYRRHVSEKGISESLLHPIPAEVLVDDLPIIMGKQH